MINLASGVSNGPFVTPFGAAIALHCPFRRGQILVSKRKKGPAIRIGADVVP